MVTGFLPGLEKSCPGVTCWLKRPLLDHLVQHLKCARVSAWKSPTEKFYLDGASPKARNSGVGVCIVVSETPLIQLSH